MTDAVEIQFRADLADLEAGTEEAVALLGKAADDMARAFEQASLKEIAIASDRNDALYRLGAESLEQWKAQAVTEAEAKYAAELQFLDRKAAADKGDAAAEIGNEAHGRGVLGIGLRQLQGRRVAFGEVHFPQVRPQRWEGAAVEPVQVRQPAVEPQRDQLPFCAFELAAA